MLYECKLTNTTPPHNKYYNITIEQKLNVYIVSAEYGKIGTTNNQFFIGSCNNLSEALNLASSTKNNKIKKGYIDTSKSIDNTALNLKNNINNNLVNKLQKDKISKIEKIKILERKHSIYSSGRLRLIVNE